MKFGKTMEYYLLEQCSQAKGINVFCKLINSLQKSLFESFWKCWFYVSFNWNNRSISLQNNSWPITSEICTRFWTETCDKALGNLPEIFRRFIGLCLNAHSGERSRESNRKIVNEKNMCKVYLLFCRLFIFHSILVVRPRHALFRY